MPVSLKQKGLRLSKHLFSSTNSVKSPLKIDLKPKTTFVAEIGNFCCFLATWTLKFSDRNFWHRDPPGAKKLDFFEKKSIFLTWLNIQHYSREARNGRNFCRTPNFSTFTIFQLSCKKIMSETFLGQKLCHGVKSRLNRLPTFLPGFYKIFQNLFF